MTEMIKAKLNGKYEIILPKHRAERPEWYTEKGWEKARLDSMHQHLGKEDVIYYVGAEEGEMAALCQMWGAKVVMFEPNDKVWPNIKAIWEANNLDFPLAVFSGFASNSNDPVNQYIHKYGEWPASADGEVIHDHGFKELNDPGGIQQIKIDTMIEKTGIIPTAITMDVEGAEWEVLQGAEETLRKYHPKIWLSLHPEFLFRIYGKYSYEVRRWLIDMGYKEELLAYDHEAHFYYE